MCLRPVGVGNSKNSTYFWWFDRGRRGRSCDGGGGSCRFRSVSKRGCAEAIVTLRLDRRRGSSLRALFLCGKLLFRGTNICHQISHQGIQIIILQIMQGCFRVRKTNMTSRNVAYCFPGYSPQKTSIYIVLFFETLTTYFIKSFL